MFNDMNLVMNISIIDFSILHRSHIYHLLPLWFENIFQCDCLVRLFKIIQSYGCFLLNVVNNFIYDNNITINMYVTYSFDLRLQVYTYLSYIMRQYAQQLTQTFIRI